MPVIRSAQLIAFYLFDVAETVDLQAVPRLVGGPAVAARLAAKPGTPAYVQYGNPPLSFDGELVGVPVVEGFRTRLRVYEYGVVSVALAKPFTGDWRDLVSAGQTLIENAELELRAEALCQLVTERLRPALTAPRPDFLSEDYLVYAITDFDRPVNADRLIAEHGEDIAVMLRGERQPLSEQEKALILQHRISYLADDLVIPTWNAALVYDTETGAQAALEILEYANSQLLEFRYYDRLLDAELSAIYAQLQHPHWYESWLGSRYTRAARHVHALLIDLNELTDRTENALKVVGDIYSARLFSIVADRLGLGRWKANVQDKLKTLDDISRFAVEQASMSRGQFLELTIVLILVLELVLLVLGVTK
jgi:hypothetical protein